MISELIVGAATVFVASAGYAAVLDPSVTNIALAAIGAVVAIAGLWAKFRTDALTMRTDALAKELEEAKKKLAALDVTTKETAKLVDGVTKELVRTTGEAKEAKGFAEGVAQAKSQAAIVQTATDKGKAAGVEQEKLDEKNRKATPTP